MGIAVAGGTRVVGGHVVEAVSAAGARARGARPLARFVRITVREWLGDDVR